MTFSKDLPTEPVTVRVTNHLIRGFEYIPFGPTWGVIEDSLEPEPPVVYIPASLNTPMRRMAGKTHAETTLVGDTFVMRVVENPRANVNATKMAVFIDDIVEPEAELPEFITG